MDISNAVKYFTLDLGVASIWLAHTRESISKELGKPVWSGILISRVWETQQTSFSTNLKSIHKVKWRFHRIFMFSYKSCISYTCMLHDCIQGSVAYGVCVWNNTSKFWMPLEPIISASVWRKSSLRPLILACLLQVGTPVQLLPLSGLVLTWHTHLPDILFLA